MSLIAFSSNNKSHIIIYYIYYILYIYIYIIYYCIYYIYIYIYIYVNQGERNEPLSIIKRIFQLLPLPILFFSYVYFSIKSFILLTWLLLKTN